MNKILKALLAGLMIIGNTNLVLAEETASDSDEMVLDLYDLDPATLNVSKLGEMDEEPEPEEEMAQFKLSDIVRVSIELDGESTIDAGYTIKNIAQNDGAVNYRAQLKAQQDTVTAEINSILADPIEVKWNLTLAMNAISAYVKYGDIAKIKTVDGVKDVFLENQYEAYEDEINTANTSSNMVGATAAWTAGYTGAGSRIAIIDTGIDTTHQSFNADAFNYSINNLDKTVTLMTSADITAVSSQLNGSGTYVSAKIPYGYNYVDGNTTITHTNDTQGEHGSHVAGIAAANRYIKSGSSYNDAVSTVKAVGMAPDAQLLVMKVFGSKGGAYDSDYMAAIEDAFVLGCDAANLSLGSGAPGFTYANSYQATMNKLTSQKDIVVTISAGNAGPFTEHLTTDLYIDDVYMHTGGSPGSFINSLCTASADNIGSTGTPLVFNGSQNVFYVETESTGAAMSSIAGSYSYVYIDATGTETDYSTINSAVSLNGKVVIVNRGDLSFYEKGNNLVSYKPKALIVANNADGAAISMGLDDYTGTFPFVSITKADADTIKANSTKATTGSYTYYTGTVQVTDTVSTGTGGKREDATVSSFSSWGVPGSLLMKPEITAPGGSIYSVNGTHKTASGTAGGSAAYETMSGTSMAAPHMAGLAAVLAQYIRENGRNVDGYTTRALNQSLLMSTATPMKNDGEYVSVLQQGSGLVDISKAISASTVIMMDADDGSLTDLTGAAEDGKVKAEIGDNPSKTSPYSFAFTIFNQHTEDANYTLKTDLFTQAAYTKNGETFMSPATTAINGWNVSYEWEGIALTDHDVNGDGTTNDADVNAILEYCAKNAAGENPDIDKVLADLDGDGNITTNDAYQLIGWLNEGHGVPADGLVKAGGSRKVTVTITPNDSLDGTYPAGAYVEGFTYINSDAKTADGGSADVEHSIPILGFYGSWTDPSMFDNTSYTDTLYGTARTPYSGNTDTNYMTVTVNGVTGKFSGNPYKAENKFPADRLAINSASKIDTFYYNLIRSAGTAGYAVTKTDEIDGNVTDVLASAVTGNEVTGQWYYASQGSWQNTGTKKYSLGKTPESYGLSEGDTFRVGFYAVPEYYGMLQNKTDMTDASAGLLNAETFANVLADNLLGKGAFIGYDFTVDNTAPEITEAALSGNTLTIKASDNANLAYLAVKSIDGTTTYAEQTPGTDEYTLSFNAATAISNAKGYVAVFAGDYAGNESAKAVKVNNNTSGVDPYTVSSITLNPISLDLYKNAAADIKASVTPITATDKKINWTSSNNNVATVDENGHVVAVGAGSATITASSNSNSSVKATCSVNVVSVNKALNGIVWDEQGDVYFSSFNASSLPTWNKLHNDSQGKELITAYYQNNLYVTSLDTSTATSTLYTVNTNSYALTEVGNLAYYAVDMAPAPTSYASRNNMMVQTYGPYLMLGDVSDPAGGIYGYGDMRSSLGDDIYLAGLAARSLSTTSASYYMLDENGIIWQVSLSGTTFGTPSKVVETGISTSFLYQSLYYDGTYLYWTHYADNVTELIIINPTSGKIYHAGNFGEGVWPVGGLYVSGKVAPASAEEPMDIEEPALQNIDLHSSVTENRLYAEAAKMESSQTAGSVNSLKDYTPASNLRETVTITGTGRTSEETDNTVKVSLYENNNQITHNGLYKVAYDSNILTYAKTVSNAAYSYVYETADAVYAAFADVKGFTSEEKIAEVAFSTPEQETKVEITTVESNDSAEIEKPAETVLIGNKRYRISSHSLNLEGKIGVNFFLNVPEDEEDHIKAVVTFNNTTTEKLLSGYPRYYADAEKTVKLRVITVDVAAAQLRDKISIKLVNTETNETVTLYSDGEAAQNNVHEYRALDYMNYMRSATDKESLKTLVNALDNYGKYAQYVFSYNTDNLDSEPDGNAIKDITAETLKAYEMVPEGSVTGLRHKKNSLALNSDTSFRVYFETEEGHAVSEYMFYIDGTRAAVRGNASTGYAIMVGNIPSALLDTEHTFEAVPKEGTGSIRMTGSALSYLYDVVSNENSTEAQKNVAKALYNYNQAANAYFGK